MASVDALRRDPGIPIRDLAGVPVMTVAVTTFRWPFIGSPESTVPGRRILAGSPDEARDIAVRPA